MVDAKKVGVRDWLLFRGLWVYMEFYMGLGGGGGGLCSSGHWVFKCCSQGHADRGPQI